MLAGWAQQSHPESLQRRGTLCFAVVLHGVEERKVPRAKPSGRRASVLTPPSPCLAVGQRPAIHGTSELPSASRACLADRPALSRQMQPEFLANPSAFTQRTSSFSLTA